MIIKKYLAKTEREAIELAKEDLGSGAVVMNIKKIHPKGLAKLFVRSKVEVTAALEESEKVNEKKPVQEIGHVDLKVKPYRPDIITDHSEEKDVSAIEEKLNQLQKIFEKQMQTKETQSPTDQEEGCGMREGQIEEHSEEEEKSIACKQLIRNTLIENEVEPKIAADLMDEIGRSLPEDATVDHILASVYQKIVLMIGKTYPIIPEENSPKFIFFLGSTGVGKTTTIAKLASNLKLGQKKKVMLATADTYRIAAVEQLKTYANILDVPLEVIYDHEELGNAIDEFRKYDVCLIDTAGRSHKNKDQISDIKKLIEQVPINEREIYLVLNAGSKYSDLKEIAEVYSEITDYILIFTKLDETSKEGVLLNMRMLTKRPLSYVTWGQNVPDDIGEVDAQKIAKKLLGGK